MALALKTSDLNNLGKVYYCRQVQPPSSTFSIMETRRTRKKREEAQLQREAISQQRNIIRSSILKRDEKILTDKQKKDLWIGKNCLNCEKVRQILDICGICRGPIPTDNLFIPACQHIFCRSCLNNYLDKTSFKYATIPAQNGNVTPSCETFKCPTCRMRVFNVNRYVHLKKNYLYSALCQALAK